MNESNPYLYKVTNPSIYPELEGEYLIVEDINVPGELVGCKSRKGTCQVYRGHLEKVGYLVNTYMYLKPNYYELIEEGHLAGTIYPSRIMVREVRFETGDVIDSLNMSYKLHLYTPTLEKRMTVGEFMSGTLNVNPLSSCTIADLKAMLDYCSDMIDAYREVHSKLKECEEWRERFAKVHSEFEHRMKNLNII